MPVPGHKRNKQYHRLGKESLESCLAEMELGMLVDSTRCHALPSCPPGHAAMSHPAGCWPAPTSPILVSSSQATLLWGCSSAWGFFAKQQQSFLTPASCLQELLLNDIVTSTLWHNFWGCFPHLSAFPSSSSAFLRYRGSAMVSSSAMRAPTTKGMNSALS